MKRIYFAQHHSESGLYIVMCHDNYDFKCTKPYQAKDMIGHRNLLVFKDFEQADLAARRAANGEFPALGRFKTQYFKNN